MIKSINFVTEEAKKKAEVEALGQLINVFSEEVAQSLMAKIHEGKIKNWDDPVSFEDIQGQMLESIKAADWVSVSALVMLIWNQGQQ